MKTNIYFTIVLIFFSLRIFSQEIKETRIPLIGEMAPEFTAESTTGKIKFPDDYFTKWKILFSHPGDFTPVCSTEILELAAMQEDFDKLDAKLIVLSVDGLNSHLEWIRSLESVNYKNRGPVKIKFPIVSDVNLVISKKYGMIHSYVSTTRDVRGVFIIDPSDRIRSIFFYPFDIGRNIDEIKRALIALQTSEKMNVLTPADWRPGQDVLIKSPKSKDEAEKMANKNDPALYSVTWYMWFKKVAVNEISE
jgi:peroxiredoxin 2/4